MESRDTKASARALFSTVGVLPQSFKKVSERMGLGGRYHGWDMDGQNGWGLGGRCHGWDMDALAERMGSGRALSWLGI